MYGHFEKMKWAEFNAGNATFAINDPSAFDPNLKAQAGGAAVPFSVDDVAAAIEELEGKGITVTVPPMRVPCATSPAFSIRTATPCGSISARTAATATNR